MQRRFDKIDAEPLRYLDATHPTAFPIRIGQG
jgi:hypothetical protein